MTAPKRIQQRRTKGWRKPEGAVAVGRPGKWGNPWRIRRDEALDKQWDILENIPDLGETSIDHAGSPERARALAVLNFRLLLQGSLDEPPPYPTVDEIRAELAGRDLMCWCPLPEPGQPDHCHAAVLIELANGPTS